jgi:hypothetical protein
MAPLAMMCSAGKQLRANYRAQAVGSDQQVGASLRAVVEVRDDFAVVSRERAEIFAEVIVRRRKPVLQRAIDARPGAHRVAPGGSVHRVAGAIQADALADPDPEALVDLDPEPAEDRKQFVMRADAGAPGGEVVADAFEHIHLPSQVVQEVGGKQPAERAADHDCACFHLRGLLPDFLAELSPP